MIKKILFVSMISVMGLMSGGSGKDDEKAKVEFIKIVKERLANGDREETLGRPIELSSGEKLDLVGSLECDPEQIKLLDKILQKGAPVSERSLVNAIREGSADQVKLLLQYGANPNKRSAGYFPLQWCASGEIFFAETLKKADILLNNGACINEKSGPALHLLVSGTDKK